MSSNDGFKLAKSKVSNLGTPEEPSAGLVAPLIPGLSDNSQKPLTQLPLSGI